jgi:Holliday junction resolvase RusA-like endonuclease
MWTTSLPLLLLFAIGDPNTKLAKAFIRNGLSGVRKIKRGESVPLRPISLRERSSNPAGTRSSCVCRAAKNAEKVNSQDLSSVPNKSAKNAKKVKKIKKSNEGPWYWIDEKRPSNFEVTFGDEYGSESEDEDEQEECKSKRISKLRFEICGSPRPLQRHRTSRFHTYNPSVKYQESFQDALKKLIFEFHSESIETPLFAATDYLEMTIIFRMKRPKSHFVNNKPGPGRLKKKAPSHLSSIRADVDNLSKFVLDSLNGLMYEDDRQIISIHATKLLDNVDPCDGSIEVYARSIEVDDVEKIIKSSISMIEQDIK